MKFSQLLDQFQEYVNETERKTEEELASQKAVQEKIYHELNQTIKELEEMSSNLTREGEDKDLQNAQLRKEQARL